MTAEGRQLKYPGVLADLKLSPFKMVTNRVSIRW